MRAVYRTNTPNGAPYWVKNRCNLGYSLKMRRYFAKRGAFLPFWSKSAVLETMGTYLWHIDN